MNKQGKDNSKAIVIVVVLLVAIFGVYYFLSQQKPLLDHAVPADLSKPNTGSNGISVSFYSCPDSVTEKYKSTGLIPLSVEESQCTKVSVPQAFTTAGSIVEPGQGGFSIVKRTSPQSCSLISDCYSYYHTNATASPYLQCYQSQCILGQISSVNLNIGVTNPSTSQITFTSVSPTTISPALWGTAMGAITPQTITPNSGYTWIATSGILTSSYENLTGNKVTFSTVVSGTNAYTNVVTTSTDSVDLVFATNPNGALNVSIISPI